VTENSAHDCPNPQDTWIRFLCSMIRKNYSFSKTEFSSSSFIHIRFTRSERYSIMTRLSLIIFCFLVFILSACDGSSDNDSESTPGPGPSDTTAINIEGTWVIEENSKDSNCPAPTPTQSFSLNVSQNGSNVTVTDDEANSFSGTLSDHTLTWSGGYPEEAPDGTPGRTTLDTMSANINTSCNNLSGSASWTWRATDGSGYSCSGTTSFTGGRSSASGCRMTAQGSSAPSGLNAYATSSGSIQLDWTDRADGEKEYIIERSEVSPSNGFDIIATLDADRQHYDDTGLTPSTPYFYRVAAVNANGQLSYSSVVRKITQSAPSASPSAPSHLSGRVLSSTAVSLTWTDHAESESQFEIYQSVSPSDPYTLVTTVSANVVSATIEGLTPDTDYVFYVVAVNSLGSSEDSSVFEVTTPVAPDQAPTLSSNLNVGDQTSHSLTLNWHDNGNDEDGYRIYRAQSESGDYTQIASTINTYYVNSGLSSETTYWYKITAYNQAGESAQTIESSATTLAQPESSPSAPIDLNVGDTTHSRATLSWMDLSENETGFQIGVCISPVSVDSNGQYVCQSGFDQIAQVGANVTSYTLTGLSKNTQYTYFARAYNDAGASADIGVSFTTGQ
jgi:fibronectin type 3 domain-containing protein